jgi:hypothetical protein
VPSRHQPLTEGEHREGVAGLAEGGEEDALWALGLQGSVRREELACPLRRARVQWRRRPSDGGEPYANEAPSDD